MRCGVARGVARGTSRRVGGVGGVSRRVSGGGLGCGVRRGGPRLYGVVGRGGRAVTTAITAISACEVPGAVQDTYGLGSEEVEETARHVQAAVRASRALYMLSYQSTACTVCSHTSSMIVASVVLPPYEIVIFLKH